MALDLGKQVGPLPLGAWFAVVGTGLGVALYSRGEAAPPEPYADEMDRDISGDEGVGVGPGWVAVPPPSTNPADTPITDNEEWGRMAINYLIAQGYDAAQSYSAITKALAGGRGDNKLGVRGYALWRIALMKYGSPPFAVDVPAPGALPVPKPPKPPPKPGKPPAKGPRWHIVRPGQTLKSLSKAFYKDPNKWHRIYDANRKGVKRPGGSTGMIENSHKIRPGWKLLIPR